MSTFYLFSAYGAIADIDIESEVLRSLGEFRFTIFTLLRVAKLRKYRAKLWYKPVKKPTSQSLKSDDETILDDTGKSLSEALLFAKHGENILCTKNFLNVRRNFCTQHVLLRFELEIFMY